MRRRGKFRRVLVLAVAAVCVGGAVSAVVGVTRAPSANAYAGPAGPVVAGADDPVPADYNGDGLLDIAVVRQVGSGLQWLIRNIKTVNFGLAGDVPVPGNYGIGGEANCRAADIAVWRPSNGNWYILAPDGSTRVINWGTAGDYPVPGDYTPHGTYDGCNGFGQVVDPAVFRPANSTLYMFNRFRGSIGTQTFTGGVTGSAGPGPYQLLPIYFAPDAVSSTGPANTVNGEQEAIQRLAFYDAINSQIKPYCSTDPLDGYPFRQCQSAEPFGLPNDQAQVQDLGRASYACQHGGVNLVEDEQVVMTWRPSNGTWYYTDIAELGQYATPIQFGLNGDQPLSGHWSGPDPLGTPYSVCGPLPSLTTYTQPAVYRHSTGCWYIYPSFSCIQWGIPY